MKFKRISKLKSFLVLGDIFIIVLSVNLACIIRVKELTISYLGLNDGTMTILIMLAIFLISFYIFDFYNTREKFRDIRFLSNLAGSLILVSLLSIALFYIFPFMIGRGIFFISLVLIGILIVIWRLFYFFLFSLKLPKKRILIVGKGKPAEAIYSFIKKIPEYKIIDFIADISKKKGLLEKEILENLVSLEKIINDYNIDDIVVTESIRSKKLNKILINCKMNGINIWDIPTFYEHFVDKLPIPHIKENWFLFADGFDKLGSNIHKRLKRAVDILVSIAILLLLFP